MIAKHLAIHVAVFAVAVATVMLLGAPLSTALPVGMLAGCLVMLIGMGRHGSHHEETETTRVLDLASIQHERTERVGGVRDETEVPSRAGDALRRPCEVPTTRVPRHGTPTGSRIRPRDEEVCT